jgi:hypothetical protein
MGKRTKAVAQWGIPMGTRAKAVPRRGIEMGGRPKAFGQWGIGEAERSRGLPQSGIAVGQRGTAVPRTKAGVLRIHHIFRRQLFSADREYETAETQRSPRNTAGRFSANSSSWRRNNGLRGLVDRSKQVRIALVGASLASGRVEESQAAKGEEG